MAHRFFNMSCATVCTVCLIASRFQGSSWIILIVLLLHGGLFLAGTPLTSCLPTISRVVIKDVFHTFDYTVEIDVPRSCSPSGGSAPSDAPVRYAIQDSQSSPRTTTPSPIPL